MNNQFAVSRILKESGWEYTSPDVKEDNVQYDVAFLIAPNIPIPNRSGNAIATLVTNLAENLDYRCLIFSTKLPEDNLEKSSTHRYGNAIYTRPIKKGFWDKGKIRPLGRHFFITPIEFCWRKYAQDAAEACIKLGVKCLVVEDVADFGWVVRKVRKNGIKVILHQHAFTQRNYRTYLWKRIERNLDKVIFVAKKTRTMTEEKHGSLKIPSSVIYNGVDLEQYDPQRWSSNGENYKRELSFQESDLVLTFVGRFTPSKGILELLEGFHQLNRKDIGMLLVCGHDQTLNPEFQARFFKLRASILHDGFNFQYLENIPQEKMPVIFSLSDLVIVPSNNSYEGLPKVVSEAVAMGVPVIASDRGGTWELLEEGKNGWRIEDPVSPQTICNALQKAVNTPHAELSQMRTYILSNDRPKMDQKRMVTAFQEEVSSLINQTAL